MELETVSVLETVESSLPSHLLKPITSIIGNRLVQETTDLRIELSALQEISSTYHTETKHAFYASHSPSLHASFLRTSLESRIKTLLGSVSTKAVEDKSVVDWMFVNGFLQDGRPESRASSTASSMDESVIIELSRGVGGLDVDEWKRIGRVLRKAVKAERDGLILEIQSVNDDMEQQILVRDKTEYIAMESVPSIDHLKKLNDKLEEEMEHQREIDAIFSRTSSTRLYHEFGATNTQSDTSMEKNDSLADLLSDFTEIDNAPILYESIPILLQEDIPPVDTTHTLNLIPQIPTSTMKIKRTQVRLMKRPSPPPPVEHIPVIAVARKSPRRMNIAPQSSRDMLVAMEGLNITRNSGRRVIPAIGKGQ